MFERPPGGLRTFVEVVGWLLSFRAPVTGLFWGGGVVLVLLGGGLSQASEKLLLPPGAWWTLTEVVPSECFEKSILTA